MHKVFSCFLFLFLGALQAAEVRVALLATTDLHGNIYPVDYFSDRPAARGLAKVASLIAGTRAENPHALLIDCGDTIQGSPLEYVYQTYVRTGGLPLGLKWSGTPPAGDPMMLVMNHLGYDAMVLGNHEFNYGLRNLEKARSDARFPWISANTRAAGKPFPPYIVKSVGGVKIAVIGITTPAVPTWEKPENYAGYRFEDGVVAARRAVVDLKARERPDATVLAVHAGLDRNLATAERQPTAAPGENMVYDLATQVPGIDAIVFGHTHSELESHRIGNVLLVQPKNWGMSLARLDFVFNGQPGAWKLTGKTSRLLKVAPETPAHVDVLRIAKPYHDAAQRYLDTPVARADAALTGALGRVTDTALIDAIHEVQMRYAKADVSFTAMFNPRVRVPKGPVTVRQIAALYLYDNELYAMEGTGGMVKDALENAARYFLSCAGGTCSKGPLLNPRVIGFNYDMAQGVTYEVDLTRPEGDRVRNLRYRGEPLSSERKLRIAINNYRAAGSAGYSMFRDAKILWQSGEDMRDLMIRHYTETKRLPVAADGNWRIVPETARETLIRQAWEDASRPATR
jgi:2',3'-cyclic-nucleotide 2'-phosphodiesterase/3'-nucleotidase